MHVLILGGTRFIGRQIAETLLEAGHEVSVLNRGETLDELPTDVERLRGDRDRGGAGLAALAGRAWDACIDTSGYLPRQVRPSTELLRSCVERYVYISAVSVYGDPQVRPVLENHPRMPPASDDVTELNQEMYGRCKVACEDVVQNVYGDRSTILRPQIVVGPGDPDGRYAYWVKRARLGGEMLAPGDGSDHLQVIDVRDVAQFAKSVVENNIGGTFNLAGPRLLWSKLIELLGAKDVVWVAAEILKSAKVAEFELPLYRPKDGPRSSLMDVSNERARAAGLVLTEPAVTIQSMNAATSTADNTELLSPEREAELIAVMRRTS